MQYAVETFSLTKVFGDWWGRSKVVAVDGLNLKIRPNEVFGLLGPNGSGKTTAIKMLLGLLHPTRGRTLVLGGDSTSPRISTRIGFLPEESYLYRFLSARETLDFYGKLFSLPSEVRRMRTESLLDMVGLRAVANRPVGTYSKGMARRIGLAQALINDPDLLILDEPTTGLDPIGTRQIKDLIIRLAQRGKTILLCSHLLADVEDVCDRIAILYGGKVRAEGKVSELLRRTAGRQINTGPLGDDALAKIRRLIESEDVECEITSPMDRLETFFIRIVAEAQQQDQPTSGAVSTTRIGDFLTRPDTTEAILDKLVAAAVDKGPDSPEPATEAVAPATPQSVEADQDFLEHLSKAPKPVDTTPITPVRPVEPAPPADIDTNILDRLTRGDDSPAPPQPHPENDDA